MVDYPFRVGEFNVLRKIGEGGMAEVFLAERGGDAGFRTMVALKRLHGGFGLDQYFIRQLVQEAKLLGQLQHNNVVRVHDLRKIDDEYFIVMEYIDGIDLAQAIQVHKDHGLRFPLSNFFHVALSLCEALEFAHTAADFEGKPIQLIHRDIKPSNVLIHHRGVVKLTDFGIARVGDASNTGSVVKGTANYMSPEQASGEEQLTPASDIFSLGTVSWEILTLEKLVEGSNYLNVINAIKELNVGLKDITRKGIEPGLRMILLRMLARKRELRYQSMGLVLKDLRFVAEQMKVDLSPSHLRQYMAKITNLAREAALKLSQDGVHPPVEEIGPPADEPEEALLASAAAVEVPASSPDSLPGSEPGASVASSAPPAAPMAPEGASLPPSAADVPEAPLSVPPVEEELPP
ncbi:MAG: serine/threonine-protein kinase, partial [Myxococcota bacterium]|nr:serine/threonine-protein kinase [Myxococcota bacterium]